MKKFPAQQAFEKILNHYDNPSLLEEAIRSGADINYPLPGGRDHARLVDGGIIILQRDYLPSVPSWVRLASLGADMHRTFGNFHSGSPLRYQELTAAICRVGRLDMKSYDAALNETWMDVVLGRLDEKSDIDNAAQVFTAGLHDGLREGLEPYRINYDSIFSYIDGGPADNPARSVQMRLIRKLLDAVQERLAHPRTAKEIALVRDYPKVVQYWQNHQTPDPDTLPRPSKSYWEKTTAWLKAQQNLYSPDSLDNEEEDDIFEQMTGLREAAEGDAEFDILGRRDLEI